MISFRFFYVRRGAVVWWAAALLVGALTFAVVARSSAAARDVVRRHGTVRQVPVAVRSLSVGDVVGAGDVAVRPVPVAFVPSGPVVRDVVGRVAVVPVSAGEVVLASKVAPAGLRGAAALVPAGWRGVTIMESSSGLPPAELGDRVDVLATAEDGRTALLSESAVVVAVADGEVTVAVPAPAAPAVAAATAASVVTLTLVSP